MYAEANTVPRAYLPAKTLVKDGILIPRPERVAPIPFNAGIYNAKMSHKADMFSASGISEERMGYESNAQSGRAVLARSQESKLTNSNITRSLNKALTYGARIINEWIPVYYDTKRVVKILDIENKPNAIEINTTVENAEVDLGDAYDDIVISMGAGYLTSRMESNENMMEFLKVNPSLAPVISDLIAENSDWSGSQKIAERIRATMPPEILEAGGDDDKAQMRKMMDELQKSQMYIQQLERQLQEISQQADDNSVQLQIQELKGQQAMILQELKNRGEIEKEVIKSTITPVERTQNDRERNERYS
jgi:hypothetical protein